MDQETSKTLIKPGPLCGECPLKDAPGPVWGDGSPHAELIVIGQNPATNEINYRDDERIGKCFVGASGEKVEEALVKGGSSRSNCFVTNMVKCFTPSQTVVPFKAIQCCRPLLEQELLNCDSRTILTVGAVPFEALTHKTFTSVTDRKKPKKWLRGCVWKGDGLTIIPTLHPAGLMTTGFWGFPIFDKDVEKAVRLAKGQGLQYTEEFNYNPTDEEIERAIDQAILQGDFSLDIETPTSVFEDEAERIGARDTEIEVAGISVEVGKCIGIRPRQLPLLARLFGPGHRRLTCYLFNQGFDAYHMGKRFDLSGVEFFDVMLALNVLYSNLQGKDLGIALSLFTEMDYTKNLAKTDPDRYNATDTYGALWAGRTCRELLTKWNLWEPFLIDEALWPVVEDMRVIGVNCDVDKALQMEHFCLTALDKYQQLWNKLLPMVSWTSNQQLIALFAAKGLPIRYHMRKDPKTKKKKMTPSVDVEVLEEYRDQYGSQIAAMVLQMRQLKKASDFTHVFSDLDGRSHASYLIHGQKAGRIQAKDPDLQNIPEVLLRTTKFEGVYPREIFIPDDPENDVIIAADFEQIEFWIYAYVSGDKILLETKKRGEYVYGQFYEAIFGKPFFESGKPRRKIFKAKTVEAWELLVAKSYPLGMLYGRGVASIVEGLGKSKYKGMRVDGHTIRAEAQKIYDNFFRDHHWITEHHERRMHDAWRDKYLRNKFNRIRRFPNPKAMRNEILAYDGQSNAADILRRNALIPLHYGLKDYRARILLTVHDSVIMSCPRKSLKGCASFIRDTMEAPIPQMDNYWIPCEITVGPNWYNTVPLEEYKG